MRKVTLKEIAESLGVSPSLVSGVLNNRPGVWASEETRQSIIREAKVRGYRPYQAARALRSGKTYNVLLVYQPIAAIPIDTIASALSAKGYSLQVMVSLDPIKMQKELQDILSAGICDAIIMWIDEPYIEPLAEIISDLPIPVVLKGRYERVHPEWYQVDFDHERMMATAVAHLRSIGHQRIGYMGYLREHEFARMLLKGYLEAMHSLIGTEIPSVYYEHCVVDPEDAEQIVDIWFSLPASVRPTAAVVGAGNSAWYGIERALFRRGLFIGEEPGDFAVCGQSYEGLFLSFGSAYAFQDLELHTLAIALVERLLLPLLSEQKPAERIVRILPSLVPVRSHLLRRYLPIQESVSDVL